VWSGAGLHRTSGRTGAGHRAGLHRAGHRTGLHRTSDIGAVQSDIGQTGPAQCSPTSGRQDRRSLAQCSPASVIGAQSDIGAVWRSASDIGAVQSGPAQDCIGHRRSVVWRVGSQKILVLTRYDLDRRRTSLRSAVRRTASGRTGAVRQTTT
jgi:hypothetical protein